MENLSRTLMRVLLLGLSLYLISCDDGEGEKNEEPKEQEEYEEQETTTSEDSLCAPGDERECECKNGKSGNQQCAKNGKKWLKCDCSSSSDAEPEDDTSSEGDSFSDADSDTDTDTDTDTDSDGDSAEGTDTESDEPQMEDDGGPDTDEEEKPTDDDTGQGEIEPVELGCPEQIESGRPTNIFVVGDSTACNYDQIYYPRTGWAQVLQPFFNTDCAKVENKASSGRSSKSFYNEGKWSSVEASIKEGDYVLIQFGHNDEKDEDPTRYTEPNSTFPEYLTKYISQTRNKGGIPILMTPLNRNKWNGSVLKDSHGEYPDATRKLAEEQDTPLVDVTELTKIYFEKIGEAETTKLFLSGDQTHLQERGAKIIAQIVVADLYQQNLPIAALLKEIPTAP